jgi:uncharacterized protein YjbI with pentapeptide repeats
MANEDQLDILRQGVHAWNKWRVENPGKPVDFEGANLAEANLVGFYLDGSKLNGANLSRANLGGAHLRGAYLNGAILVGANLEMALFDEACINGSDLRGAFIVEADLHASHLKNSNLDEATIRRTNLMDAKLSDAKLRSADLCETNFINANLNRADLTGADLTMAQMVGTHLWDTKLTGCRVFGVSAWNLELNEGTDQKNLIITPSGKPNITVDNLQVAQFLYLLLHNENIRRVIDTITSKVVLIIGRFSPERKAVLDAIRGELRRRDYLPVLFDFDKPTNRDLTESISTLAHMARFVIADITEAKSIPAELQSIVPDLPSVPVMPLTLRSDKGYALFDHIRRYSWVLEPYEYENQLELIASLDEKVIAPAEAKVTELRKQAFVT